MKKIHFDQSGLLSRLGASSITWVILTGALAWTGGYVAGGHGPIPEPARSPSAVSAPGLFGAMEATAAGVSSSGKAPNVEVEVDLPPKIALLKRVVVDFDPKKQPLDDYNQLIVMARDDPNLRHDIVKRMESATDPQVKLRLSMLITHIGTPDMKDYAGTLAASSDPAKRSDGFRMLSNMDAARINSDVRRQLIGALEKENDPAALQSLIFGMNPGEIRPPQEVATIVKRLSDLSKHPDVSVRAAAIGSISRWTEGDKVEGIITEALADPSTDVARAAIHASLEAGIKTPAVKGMLFQLAAQQNATIDFRRAAASTLSNYNLSPQDFERLMQLRQELGAKGM